MGLEQKRKPDLPDSDFFPRSRRFQCNARWIGSWPRGADPVRHCLRHVPRRAEVVKGFGREGSRCAALLPDGYSQIFRLHVFGPLGFWTMATLPYAAKFDQFLSLDCAPTPSILAQSKERKGSNFCHPATLVCGRARIETRGGPVEAAEEEEGNGFNEGR